MANINFQKIILKIIREGITPVASPKYPETWLLRQTIKYLDKEIDRDPEESIRRSRYGVSRTFKKLINDKMVFIDNDGFPSLTKKGELLLSSHELNDYAITVPEIWDGKYRVIIFDIAEQKNKIRTALRRQLVAWGFVRLQNSVWVHPYECQEVVSLLKSSFGVSADVIYMTVESIENDNWLKKEFQLG